MNDTDHEIDCPRCGEPTDPDMLSEHYELGLCCYTCACQYDFPPEQDWNV